MAIYPEWAEQYRPVNENSVRYMARCPKCRKAHAFDARPNWGFAGEAFEGGRRDVIYCECGAWLRDWKPVKGRYSDKHECDARCTHATRPQCDCSCAGANHGRDYL